LVHSREHTFIGRELLFHNQTVLGQWEAAEETWRLLDAMGRNWERSYYVQGEAEMSFARSQFWQGTMQEGHLAAASSLAEKDNNRATLREVHQLRGAWLLERREWELAAASFQEAVRMARERRLLDEQSEAGLALAKLHLQQLGTHDEARQEAERLAGQRAPAHRYLAMLWLAIGNAAEAEKHALAAYKWGWADGEPYVDRYELSKTIELLREMSVPIPSLPPYNPAKDQPFPWEATVRAAIAKLRATKAARKKAGKRKSD
jgi:tetratricopeptide (TPR) repeat protein